jgi:hypothetical protein
VKIALIFGKTGIDDSSFGRCPHHRQGTPIQLFCA